MFGFLRKKKENEGVYRDEVLTMADYLMSKGFKPSDALKEAENFWNKHGNKLKSVI